MKTKLIFDQEGIQVYETNNGDERGKEWYVTNGADGFSLDHQPALDIIFLKRIIEDYLQDKAQEDHSETVDRSITND